MTTAGTETATCDCATTYEQVLHTLETLDAHYQTVSFHLTLRHLHQHHPDIFDSIGDLWSHDRTRVSQAVAHACANRCSNDTTELWPGARFLQPVGTEHLDYLISSACIDGTWTACRHQMYLHLWRQTNHDTDEHREDLEAVVTSHRDTLLYAAAAGTVVIDGVADTQRGGSHPLGNLAGDTSEHDNIIDDIIYGQRPIKTVVGRPDIVAAIADLQPCYGSIHHAADVADHHQHQLTKQQHAQLWLAGHDNLTYVACHFATNQDTSSHLAEHLYSGRSGLNNEQLEAFTETLIALDALESYLDVIDVDTISPNGRLNDTISEHLRTRHQIDITIIERLAGTWHGTLGELVDAAANLTTNT